jgi:hypothetical protein
MEIRDWLKERPCLSLRCLEREAEEEFKGLFSKLI